MGVPRHADERAGPADHDGIEGWGNDDGCHWLLMHRDLGGSRHPFGDSPVP